jgi:4-carboxymuconolactone decarboxylase
MAIQSRLSPLSEEQMDELQRAVLREIISGSRGNLDGPFLAWTQSPELANHAQRLGAFCRYGMRLELRLTELAILVTASWWQSQAGWQIHEPIARSAGVSGSVIESIKQQMLPEFQTDDERIVYCLGRALYEYCVDDAL